MSSTDLGCTSKNHAPSNSRVSLPPTTLLCTRYRELARWSMANPLSSLRVAKVCGTLEVEAWCVYSAPPVPLPPLHTVTHTHAHAHIRTPTHPHAHTRTHIYIAAHSMQSSGSGLGGVCGIGMGIFFVCYAAANRQGVDEGCAPQYTWILTTGIVQLVSGCAGIVFTCCDCLVCCEDKHNRGRERQNL